MHEESLGAVIRDYLTGEEIEETSYEEFRQALARLFVEERGYPRKRLTAKAGVCFPVDGQDYTRMVDLSVSDETGAPVMLALFCSGEPGSYAREAVAACRLFANGPAPLALVTDTKEAILIAACSGETLARGMRGIPHFDDLLRIAGEHPCPPLGEDAIEKERRILFTYSEFLQNGCCHAFCRPKAAK